MATNEENWCRDPATVSLDVQFKHSQLFFGSQVLGAEARQRKYAERVHM